MSKRGEDTKRTVFILGAGASMPYGFPSGYNLVSKILHILDTQMTNEIWHFIDKINQTRYDDFRLAIRHTVTSAIDDLLVQRREFLEIGKLSIALALSQYEDENKLTDRANEDNWYAYFFDHIRKFASPQMLENEHYSFITFNYDRSLEHYLHIASEGFYGNTNELMKKAIQKIPILHIHGHLGFLPNNEHGHPGTPYRSDLHKSSVFTMSHSLKLIEEETDVNTLTRAQILLQKAGKIRFLGFGFHSTNLKKLDFTTNAQNCNDKKGTAVGLSKPERDKIWGQNKISLDNENRKILKFFRECDPL